MALVREDTMGMTPGATYLWAVVGCLVTAAHARAQPPESNRSLMELLEGGREPTFRSDDGRCVFFYKWDRYYRFYAFDEPWTPGGKAAPKAFLDLVGEFDVRPTFSELCDASGEEYANLILETCIRAGEPDVEGDPVPGAEFEPPAWPFGSLPKDLKTIGCATLMVSSDNRVQLWRVPHDHRGQAPGRLGFGSLRWLDSQGEAHTLANRGFQSSGKPAPDLVLDADRISGLTPLTPKGFYLITGLMTRGGIRLFAVVVNLRGASAQVVPFETPRGRSSILWLKPAPCEGCMKSRHFVSQAGFVELEPESGNLLHRLSEDRVVLGRWQEDHFVIGKAEWKQVSLAQESRNTP